MKIKKICRKFEGIVAQGVLLLILSTVPCCADEMCPDFPAHDAVLQDGKGTLRESGKISPFGGDKNLDSPIYDFGAGIPGEPASVFKSQYIDFSGDLSRDLKRYFSSKSTGSSHAELGYKLGLETIEYAVVGDSFLSTDSKLLDMLTHKDDELVRDKGAMQDAVNALNIAFKTSVDLKLNVHIRDALCLAGVRDWLGDKVGASEIYEWILPALKTTPIAEIEYTQEQSEVLGYMAAMAARRGDWKSVSEFESLCKTPKSIFLTDTLLNVYKNHDHPEDLMRLYRASFEWEPCNLPTFMKIVQLARDDDRERIASSLNRKGLTDLHLALALEKRGFYKEACRVALKQTESFASEQLAVQVDRLTSSGHRDDLVRVACATAIELSAGDMNRVRFLLKRLKKEITYLPDTSDDDLQFKREFCKVVIGGMSKCKDAECIQIVKDISVQSATLSTQAKKRECISLANKLQETGEELQRRGNYAKAQEQLISALDIRRKNLVADDPLIAETLLALAQLNALLKKNNLADSQFQECIEFYKRTHKTAQLKAVLQNYGSFLNQTGQSAKASAIYKQSLHVVPNK